jgi:hypothetical protein
MQTKNFFCLIHLIFLTKYLLLSKTKGSNLKTILTNTFKSVVFCFPLQLPVMFVRSCFGYVMLKVAQYDTNDANVYEGFH